MMQLFINNVEVFAEYPEDLYPNLTYKSIDTFNPSAIKSNYSKTIKIPDHPVNNKVFAIPQERYNWILYKNGHIIEQGYCTLDSVTETYNRKYYNITLYGQLGDFFYNLKGEDENPKSLADLTYGWSGESTITYPWTVSNIKAGWDDDDTDPTSIHHTIKAIPCINKSSNFDRKKTLVYEGGDNIPSTYSNVGLFPQTSPSSSGATCKTVGGVDYLLVESNEATAFERQDFRIDQMPIGVRYKDIINACCDSDNNGGYTVNLDNSFFNDNNPYWNNTYVIRETPHISYDYSSATHEYSSWDSPTSTDCAVDSTPYTWAPTAYSDSFFTVNSSNELNGSSDIYSGNTTVTFTPMIQLPDSYTSTHMSSINAICLPNPGTINITFYLKCKYPDFGSGYTITSTYYEQSFSHSGPGTVTYPIIANRIEGTRYFKMDPITLNLSFLHANPEDISVYMVMTPPTSYWVKYDAGSIHGYEAVPSGTGVKLYLDDIRTGQLSEFSMDMEVSYVNSGSIINPTYSKEDLLGSSKTPFDYLTAFTKMFNLRYYMHEDNKTIDIMPSSNFVNTNNIIDLDDKIDFSKEYKFEPKIIDEGSILFNLDSLTNDTVSEYMSTVKNDIYDHEVKFRDRDGVKDYVDSNILKIGSLNRFSGVLNKRSPIGQTGTGPFNQVTYYGFNQSDPYKLGYVDSSDQIKNEDYNLNVSVSSSQYDFLDLSSEMNDVLVMYSGKKTLTQGTSLLSSSSKDMIIYAGKPCFISGWNDTLSTDTAVSIFGGDCYIISEVPYFGLVPSVSSAVNALSYENMNFKSLVATSNIYDQYFDPIISKIYNDQRMVTCYVRLSSPDLRSVYYFNKQYWLLVEVDNYNFNDTPVKCKFVKYTPA